MDLIDLAQDRGRLQDDVNAVINLQGPKNAGNSAALQ
jgi:hypothetical protein